MEPAAARNSFLLGVLGMAVAMTACYGGNGAPMRVSGNLVQPSAAVAVAIQPDHLVPISVPTFGCPAVPPLTTTFAIVVRPFRVDLRLQDVKLQFTDGTSLGGSPIPIQTPDLVRLFESTVVLAGTSRSFPFSVQFGCFPIAPVRLVVDTTLVDGQGMPVRSSASVPIR